MKVTRATIRDVAKEAGVSPTTVSDAMNGKGRVDPATRARVRSAAEGLGWTPQRAARALRSGRTGTIAFRPALQHVSTRQVPLDSEFHLELAAECANEAANAGLLVLLAPGVADQSKAVLLEVDAGIVVHPAGSDTTLEILTAAGIAAVTIGRNYGADSKNWVGPDSAAATTLALEHLADKGAESITLLDSSTGTSWLGDTVHTYIEWCEANDVAVDVRNVDSDRVVEHSSELVEAMVEQDCLADAIFAGPYGSAVGVVEGLATSGLRAPDDLLVVSGGDGALMSTGPTAISALCLPAVDIAREAVALAVSLLNGEVGVDPRLVQPTLVVRESTNRADKSS